MAYSCFNSRTPGGVRRGRVPLNPVGVAFQFTHPGRGATSLIITQMGDRCVSIHAPREGCDWKMLMSCLIVTGFNSRTPGGVRLSRSARALRVMLFQFTHPGRGATL